MSKTFEVWHHLLSAPAGGNGLLRGFRDFEHTLRQATFNIIDTDTPPKGDIWLDGLVRPSCTPEFYRAIRFTMEFNALAENPKKLIDRWVHYCKSNRHGTPMWTDYIDLETRKKFISRSFTLGIWNHEKAQKEKRGIVAYCHPLSFHRNEDDTVSFAQFAGLMVTCKQDQLAPYSRQIAGTRRHNTKFAHK